MIPVVPSLNNFPETISLPRDRRLAHVVLVISGIWMMFGGFSAIWMPLVWPEIDFALMVTITVVITFSAIFIGIAALRRYASQDEVTIDDEGIALKQYNWFGITRKEYRWSDIATVRQEEAERGYHVLVLEVSGDEPIPVYIARDEYRIRKVRSRIDDLHVAAACHET